MTEDDYLALKAAILADPDCSPYIVTNDMPKDSDYLAKDAAIANIFNAARGTRIVEHYVNDIGMLREIGTVRGAVVVKKLETMAQTSDVLSIVMRAFKSERGINVGDPETRAFLDQIAVDDAGATADQLTITEATAIKSLAVRPSSLAIDVVKTPITVADVSIALRNY